MKLLEHGEPLELDEDRASAILAMENLEILVEFYGSERREDVVESVLYTCDLSHEYVTINGDYRT